MHSDFESTTTPRDDRRADRRAGWVLLAVSVLSVAAMSHHPTIHSSEPAAFLDELARKSGVSSLVHGVLIALLALQVLAYGYVADRLGRHRWLVRAGVLAYGGGAACLAGAALVSGFVVGGLAEILAGRPEVDPQSAQLVFAGLHQINQSLAVAGSLALSVAAVAWSGALLLGRSRWTGQLATAAGVLGLVVGIATAAGLISGRLHLDVQGMGAVVLSLALWGALVACWMIRAASSGEQDRGFSGL